MSFTIEKASIADAEEILILQKLAYRSEAEIYGDFSIEPLAQTLDEFIKQFVDHIILKAEMDGTIIGSVRAYEKNGTCFIGKLIVHPDHQNKGIGKKLMSAIENLFSASRYELFTGYKSEKNITLYEKLGYRIFKSSAITPNFSLVFLEKKNSWGSI